jgi:hypothetical protein
MRQFEKKVKVFLKVVADESIETSKKENVIFIYKKLFDSISLIDFVSTLKVLEKNLNTIMFLTKDDRLVIKSMISILCQIYCKRER